MTCGGCKSQVEKILTRVNQSFQSTSLPHPSPQTFHGRHAPKNPHSRKGASFHSPPTNQWFATHNRTVAFVMTEKKGTSVPMYPHTSACPFSEKTQRTQTNLTSANAFQPPISTLTHFTLHQDSPTKKGTIKLYPHAPSVPLPRRPTRKSAHATRTTTTNNR